MKGSGAEGAGAEGALAAALAVEYQDDHPEHPGVPAAVWVWTASTHIRHPHGIYTDLIGVFSTPTAAYNAGAKALGERVLVRTKNLDSPRVWRADGARLVVTRFRVE